MATLLAIATLLFPTGVGMIRIPAAALEFYRPFPHGCGDDPDDEEAPPPNLTFSPRVWG